MTSETLDNFFINGVECYFYSNMEQLYKAIERNAPLAGLGGISIDYYIKRHLFPKAIRDGKNGFVNKFLDEFDVDRSLSTRERIAVYFLLEER